MAIKAAFLTSLGFAQAASAADMPAKAPVYKVPAAVAPYNWTGIYVGLQGGYGWGRSEQYDGPAFGSATTGQYNMNGWVGGGTIGANWQTGMWVLGVEGDLSASSIKGGGNTTPSWGCAVADGCTTEVKWFGTARVRVGAAFDRSLVYITGGGAFGSVRVAIAATTPSIEGTVNRTGWSAGAGYEYAFSPNWSGKLEYLHVDLGRDFTWWQFGAIPGLSRASFDVARVGINYKF